MEARGALKRSIEDFVTKLFIACNDGRLLYHNLEHTKRVVKHCVEIGLSYHLSGEESLILHAAAWFHDTGHLMQSPEGHEIRSAALMSHYCRNAGMAGLSIGRAEKCILATQLPQHPNALLEEILCDADLYHLGTDSFFAINDLVRKEFELQIPIATPEWNKSTLAFLENHSYFTSYCKKLLDDCKQTNIEAVKKRIGNAI